MAQVETQQLHLSAEERRRFGRIRDLPSLQQLDPVAFERFAGYLFWQQGYTVFTTPNSGDQGVDLFVRKGRQVCVVQCKRYRGTVGQPVVRDLFGVMIHNAATEAILVTSGRISPAARTWAQDKPIQLLDGSALLAWAQQPSPPGWLPETPLVRQGLWASLGILAVALLLALGRAVLRPSLGAGPAPTPVAITQATMTPDSQDSVANARFVTAAPTIDGDIGDWPGAPYSASTAVVYSAPDWDGVRDINAYWQLAWDANNLYVAVRVEDDRHVQTQFGERLYEGDSLEIQLDGAGGQRHAALTPSAFQVSLSPGDFQSLPPAAWRWRGATSGQWVSTPGQQVQVAARPVEEGYWLEAAILWSDLGLRPQGGEELALALNAIDNDRPGQALQEVMVSQAGTRRFRNPASWGTLRLTKP